MKHFTLEDIRKAEQDFIPCPFCKKKPKIVFSDDECNWKDQDDVEYLENPWSGLCFMIEHGNENCPIRPCEMDNGHTYSFGYPSPEEAVEDWNKHLKKHGDKQC